MVLSNVPRYDSEAVSTIGDRAVVVGGSVAGLVAARVLADGFERVAVVERDDPPDEPVTRDGVPQGSHIHALQEAGRATLEDLFPGYGEDLLAAGGLLLDGATDLAFYTEGDFLAEGPDRLPFYSASRPLYEHVARQRLHDVAGVRLLSGATVTEYLADDGANAVEGVRVRDEGGTDRLAADLVVDATGRTSRTPEWLEDRGYAAPPLDEVHVDVGYGTAVVERPPVDRRAILAIAEPPHTRGGAAFPVEGDRWLVNLHGVHGDHPPTDWGAFEAFAESLHLPHFARLLAENRPVDREVDFYPFPSSRRYRYEDLDRFPDGLVVLGDAIASFNPVYGQGMSVAAMEAVQLHHALATGGLEDLPRRFFERAATVVDPAWALAVGTDHHYPETTGPVPRGAALFDRYVSRLLRAAHDDGALREAFMRVVGMERHPTSLLRPGLAWRVLGHGARSVTARVSATGGQRARQPR